MHEHAHDRLTGRRWPYDGRSDRSGTTDGAERDADVRDIRIGAKALVTSPERVLLIEERHADGSSFWTLPGGGVEPDESLPECLRREVDEEIRCGATVDAAVGSYIYAHRSRPVTTLYAVFGATLHAVPEPNSDEQVIDHGWWEPGELPPATLDPVAEFITKRATPDRK